MNKLIFSQVMTILPPLGGTILLLLSVAILISAINLNLKVVTIAHCTKAVLRTLMAFLFLALATWTLDQWSELLTNFNELAPRTQNLIALCIATTYCSPIACLGWAATRSIIQTAKHE